MEGKLRVTPERLIQSAEVFSSKATSIASVTTEMTNLVTGLATSIWQGDAANAVISRFRQLDDDIQKIVGMVNEHSKDLTEMAGNYKTAETLNEDMANSLDIDVIL